MSPDCFVTCNFYLNCEITCSQRKSLAATFEGMDNYKIDRESLYDILSLSRSASLFLHALNHGDLHWSQLYLACLDVAGICM